MKLEVHGRSDPGLVRSRNEDAFAIWPTAVPSRPSFVFCAIADGMGGHPGGDVASRTAVDTVTESPDRQSDESPNAWLLRLHRSAAERVRSEAQDSHDLKEMGTTLTVALFLNGACHVSHIGDTRLYWIRGDRCLLVTRDHTVAQEMVEAGRLPAEESEGHPMGNVLTRCLGICPEQEPDLLDRGLQLETGDTLLLASDGLVKTIPTRELAARVAKGSIREAVDGLIEASREAGAPDNTTVILVRVLDPERGAEDGAGWTFAEAYGEISAS